MERERGRAAHGYLVSRAGAKLLALALPDVVEVLRPLPLSRLEGAPPFVLGAAVIRGAPVPVIDARALLGVEKPDAGAAARWISLRVGDRRAALAVDAVDGARTLDGSTFGAMPPLLRNAAAGVGDAIAALDQELLLVLEAARLVPEAVWNALSSGARA